MLVFLSSFFLKLCGLSEVGVGNTEECNIVEKKCFFALFRWSRGERREMREIEMESREKENQSRDLLGSWGLTNKGYAIDKALSDILECG